MKGSVRAIGGSGKRPTTRLLVDGIVASGASLGDVLDIGGGFGGLTRALLERGATGGTVVDASEAYTAAARVREGAGPRGLSLVAGRRQRFRCSI